MKQKENFVWRKIQKDITSIESFERLIQRAHNGEDISFYVGIDPTAPDLHIGHLLSIISAKLISEQYNLNPIFIIGGLTATIGDPSGKNSERKMIDLIQILKNSESIVGRLNYLLDKLNFDSKKVVIKNNLDFYEELSIVDFFRIFGKNFNLNKMLSKDMIKQRLEVGISYTEFSYQIFQAIDFYFLNKDFNCMIQIGGSDQWGNIVSGIELIKKMSNEDNDVTGITTHLILDKHGKKVGKSEGRPLWVNEDKTSSYFFHQYFINLEDEIAETFLRTLTLISKEDYDITIELQKQSPKTKPLQNRLSKEFLTLFYSSKSYEEAIRISNALFSNSYDELSLEDIKKIGEQIGIKKISASTNQSFYETLIDFNLLPSKREINEFIKNDALKVNGIPVKEDFQINNFSQYSNRSDDDSYIIDIGKKKKVIYTIE